MTAPYFHVDEHPYADHTRLSLVGELELMSASRFEDRLDELAAIGREVRLDLSRLDFIDSTGIRVLIRALLKSSEDGWQLEIEPNVTDTVRRVFNLVNLDRHLVGEPPRRIPDEPARQLRPAR
jgi:anti-sigma B factor antagonist